MAIRIQGYTEDLVASVRDFNQRLCSGGVDQGFFFPETHIPDYPPLPDRALYQERFLAVESGIVRGGFMLRHQEFSFGGEVRSIAHYRHPISEGIIDRAYTSVGLQILRHALQLQPLLFALGMGGLDQPLPRLLKAMGWRLDPVPFYFKVIRPRRFLRHIRPLRRTALRRLALDAAAFTGAGVGIKAWHWWKTARPENLGSLAVTLEPAFCAWADQLWERCKPHYACSAVRDSRTLQLLYPPEDDRFLRMKISLHGDVAGWVVALDTPMRGHNQFGDMRVGTIVDCMALPEHTAAVTHAAAHLLAQRGVDMILSNQSHRSWRDALAADGFLQGPSNYILATSRELTALMPPFDLVHFNRGDGDGPIHL